MKKLIIVFILAIIIIGIGGAYAYQYFTPKNNTEENLNKSFMTAMFNNSSQFVNQKDIAGKINQGGKNGTQYLIWKPTAEEIPQNSESFISDIVKNGYDELDWINIPTGYLVSAPLFLYQTIESNIPRAYFLAETMLGSCHACAPFLGAAVFEKNENDWKLVYTNKYIDEVGSFGIIPTPSLFPIGNNKNAFEFEMSDAGQGYGFKGVTMYAFTNNQFYKIFNAQTGGDNSGVTKSPDASWSWDSTITTKPNPNYDFYDVVIKSTGTDLNLNNGKIISADKIDTYHWDKTKNKYIKY